jgi:hypothetical protein
VGEIVASPATTLFVAPSDDKIVGMFTLLLFRIPTGLRAIFEGRARSAGARTVDFTSRPSRETAHRLYLRLGFAVRDTQVYRYPPDRHN